MTTLAQLCSAFGLDEQAAGAALEAESRDAETRTPWYVQALLAMGSWIAALVIIAFGCFVVVLVFDFKGDTSFGVALGVLGAIFFVPGYLLLQRDQAGIFAGQFGTAIAAAGQGMVAVGAGFMAESVVASAVVSVPFAIFVAMAINGRILQALSSLWAAILVIVALHELEFPYPLEVTALGFAAAAWLLIRPPQRDLAPTAIVLLLLGPITAIVSDFRAAFGIADVFDLAGWIASGIYGAVTVWLFYTLWQRTTDQGARLRIALFVAAAVVLSALLPPGGSGAVAILVIAFMLGSHMLAALGIALQVYFLSKFYYDLDITLLTKSMILVAVGAIILGLWAVMARTFSLQTREPGP